MPYWNGETYRSLFRCFVAGDVINGTDLTRLQRSIEAALGIKKVFLFGSGSLALEIILRGCNIGPGDEVVVPTFCCAAVILPVLSVGATPVLADMGDELNVTPETVSAALTRKGRAIIVPHLFGNPADIEAIVALARDRNVRVIDDAAQALGATIAGRAVGSFGDAGILSFGKEKICFGLGGGAAIVRREELVAKFSTNNLDPPRLVSTLKKACSAVFAHRWRSWTLPVQRALARPKSPEQAAPIVSYRRERMANLNAAVANSLVDSLEENLSARRARVRAYRDLFEAVDGVHLFPHRAGSACLTQVARILPRRRRDLAAEVIASLRRAGYEVQGSYVPIHLLDSYPLCVWDRLPNAERMWAYLIELPCEPDVKLDDVERIAAVVKKTLANS